MLYIFLGTMHYKQIVILLLVLTLSRAWRLGHSVPRVRRLPDSEFQISTNFEPEIPEHCQHQGICDDVPNYPRQYIDYLLQHNSTVRSMLSFMASGYESARSCSGGSKPSDVDLCASTIQEAHPKAGRDANGRWYYLAADHSLCVEVCTHPDEPCSDRHMRVDPYYKATCRQKHITRRMAALDLNGAVTYIDINLIASGCCCHIE